MFLIIQILYFLLPAYLANATGTLFSKWRFLAAPLDHQKKLGNAFILGPSRTYRGAILGIIAAVLTVFAQTLLFSRPFFKQLSLIDYQQTNWLDLGLLSGLGSILGPLANSFIKRRLGFASGAAVPFLDQWDFLISYLLLASLLVNIPLKIILISLVLTLIVHPLSNIFARLIKLKNVWW